MIYQTSDLFKNILHSNTLKDSWLNAMILVKICFRLTGFMRIISVNDKAQVIDLADVDSAKYLKKILNIYISMKVE